MKPRAEALAFISRTQWGWHAVQLDVPALGFISTTGLDAREYLQALERESLQSQIPAPS